MTQFGPKWGNLEEQLYRPKTGPDGKPLRQLDPSRYVNNMFDPNMWHYMHTPHTQSGWMSSVTNSGALFDPNAVEMRTGMGTGGVMNDTANFGLFGRKAFAKTLSGLDDNGFKLEGNGAQYDVAPETVAFMKATMPWYTMGKDQVKDQIGKNVRGIYDKQGTWQAMNGFKKFNTRTQQDLNAMYQHALYEMNSGDSKTREHGRQMMNIVARAQSVFNTAQPQVSAQMKQQWNDKVQGVKKFMGNNWWWMVPGGLLAVGGLASAFGGGNGQQPQQQGGWPFAQNNSPRQNLPTGWYTGMVAQQDPSKPPQPPQPLQPMMPGLA